MPGSPIAILQIQLTRSGASDEHPFAKPTLNIGRAADNDVILEDPQVSGHHLRIEVAGAKMSPRLSATTSPIRRPARSMSVNHTWSRGWSIASQSCCSVSSDTSRGRR